MLRSLLSGRRFCTSAPSSMTSVFHKRVTDEFDKLMEVDWVDTDDDSPIELVIEAAEGVIDEYRKIYKPDAPQDDLYDDVATLYYTKEAASVVESYAELTERTLRRHEGMIGFFGNNTKIPEGEGHDAIALLQDYIKLINSIEDERIREKVDTELGRKIIHMKMMLSVENFGVEIAPIAGDRLIPTTPQPKKIVEPSKIDKKIHVSTQS